MVFDPLYLLIAGPFLLLGMIAQYWVKSTFLRYARERLHAGLSGAEVADHVLRSNGISSVRIEPAQGMLGDHYDPRERVMRLSPDVYAGRSVAAAAVAAHEAGHALQHATGYAPLAVRSVAVPFAIAADKIVFLLILVGFMAQAFQLFFIAGCVYAFAVFLAFVTLPVEFDASRRALAQLTNTGVVYHHEVGGVRSVLTAAASTYVVAALASLATMLYFFMRARR